MFSYCNTNFGQTKWQLFVVLWLKGLVVTSMMNVLKCTFYLVQETTHRHFHLILNSRRFEATIFKSWVEFATHKNVPLVLSLRQRIRILEQRFSTQNNRQAVTFKSLWKPFYPTSSLQKWHFSIYKFLANSYSFFWPKNFSIGPLKQ